MNSASTLTSKSPFVLTGEKEEGRPARSAGPLYQLPGADGDKRPGGWPTNRKRRNILLAVLAAIVVLAVALGAGLGVGLHKRTQSSRGGSSAGGSSGSGSGSGPAKQVPYTYSLPGGNSVPVPSGQDDSKAGMLESGYYTTPYTNSSGSEYFQWTAQAFHFNGTTPAPADISIFSDQTNAAIDGFGAALTDASASLLLQVKKTNSTVYNDTMRALFNRRSGLSILRVPIGSSDYSLPGKVYTFADSQGSSSDPLSKFSDRGAKAYVYPILRDALKVNPDLKISILPWSPPAWMKTNSEVVGGALNNGMTNTLAEYLAKSVQAFDKAIGVKPWALSVQNEPFNSMPYPSMVMSSGLQIQLLNILRGRLGELGYGSTFLWGLEDDFVHWDMAESLVKANASSFDGITWHCYNGSWQKAQSLRSSVGNEAKSLRMAMTECTGQDTDTSDDQASFRWWSQNIFFPMLSHNFSSVLVWNLALNSQFGPHLGSTICQNCKGAIEIDPTSVKPSLQSIMLQHMSVAAADLTRFGGKPAMSLNATLAKGPAACAEVLAFSAPWNASVSRYGLVVENSCNRSEAMTVALNRKSTSLNVLPGLSTFVWTM